MSELVIKSEPVKRSLHFDLLRVICVFSVAVLHIATQSWLDMPPGSVDWITLTFYNSLTRFCVPVLFMISGALFLDPSREVSIKKLFKKNILRIVTAYCFWSACYAFLGTFLKFKTISIPMLLAAFDKFIIGHYHLWFLFVLFGLYLIVPFLRLITQDLKLTGYFLLLCLIFGSFIPYFTQFGFLAPNLPIVIDQMKLFFPMGYVGYFVAGYYFTKISLSSGQQLFLYVFGLLSFIMTFVGTCTLSVIMVESTEIYFNNIFPFTLLIALSIFVFFKEKVSKASFLNKYKDCLLSLSACSFGIYLVHDAFKILFERVIGLSAITFNPMFFVPLLSIAVFGASYFVILIIKKIPILNKFIM